MLESWVYDGWTNINIMLGEEKGGEKKDLLSVKRWLIVAEGPYNAVKDK